MNAIRIRLAAAAVVAACSVALGANPSPSAKDAVGVTAVCSRVSKDYVRARLPGGAPAPEDYVLVKGGRQEGPTRDPSMDDVEFIAIAKALAGPLASQNYRPAAKQDTGRLLIMVYWGTTTVPASAPLSPFTGGMDNEVNPSNASLRSLDNVARSRIDAKNARLLGYDSDLKIAGGAIGLGESRNHELLEEIEDSRYFVILLAFDFEAFRASRTKTLLWETRFSLDESRNFFDKALPVMARDAAGYFGRDSRGLLRTKVPEGRVLMGEPRSLGEVGSGP